MSILQAELLLCKWIDFDYIVQWNTTADLCDDLQNIQSVGITNPQSIFENPRTKNAFTQSEIIVFLTDGQIQHQDVAKVRLHSSVICHRISLVLHVDRKSIE